MAWEGVVQSHLVNHEEGIIDQKSSIYVLEYF